MKKVGIVTLYHGNNNYGGILQAYALNRTVRQLGYRCMTIDYLPSSMSVKEKFSRKISQEGVMAALKAAFCLTVKGMWKKGVRFCTPGITEKIEKREEKMKEFRRYRIPHTRDTYDSRIVEETADEFDLFLCGSDQIWNMGCAGSFDPVYWLDFVPEGKKKAAYAASMPLPEIPLPAREEIKRRVRALDGVSVREEQGKKLLEPLLGKKIPVVLDPVFLMEKSHFEQMSKKRIVRQPYVFAYFLGGSTEARESVVRWAKGQNLRVVSIPYLLSEYRRCDRNFGDEQIWDAGPEEFLSLIRYSEYVITDSFHAAAFSAVFHREFWVFKRDGDGDKRSMNTRMEYLMKLFQTADRLVAPSCLEESFRSSEKIDYRRLDRRIETEKKKSLEYLVQVLQDDVKEEKAKDEGKSA